MKKKVTYLKLNKLAPIILEHLFLFKKLSPVLFRILLIFERFFPTFILIILNNLLEGLRSEKKVIDYRIKVIRKNRLDYKIEIGIMLSRQQVSLLFDDLTNILVEGIQNIKLNKKSDDDDELDEMSKRFLLEILNATSKDLADSSFAKTISQLQDVDYAKSLLSIVEEASKKSECGLEKKQVIKGLIHVTWLQRMHSTIRSLLLGLVAAAISLPFLLFLGSLSIIHNILLFMPIFIIGLIITRLLDKQIVKVAKRIVNYLSRHKKLRKFLMNYI